MRPCSAYVYACAYPQIRKRGSPPLGGGEILILCPIVRQVKTINFVEPGKIKRIRGIAYASSVLNMCAPLTMTCRHAVRVSPQFSTRMIESARSVLNQFIPDIYLYSDVYKGDESGKCGLFILLEWPRIEGFDRSPGYALSLVAESTTSALHCAEAVSQPGVAPGDVALQAARLLLNEVERGGCVDQKHQILILLMMLLGSEDVGRCRMAEPTERT